MEALEAHTTQDDINTNCTAARVKTIRYCTQTEERKATGRRRSLNTNHCGVLAAGRRKGEAQLGNEVKGILSLCQILQGK